MQAEWVDVWGSSIVRMRLAFVISFIASMLICSKRNELLDLPLIRKLSCLFMLLYHGMCCRLVIR